jgi:hypothetical protein
LAHGDVFYSLGAYAEAGTFKTEALPVVSEKKKDKKEESPTLMLKIESQWLKLNNKKLVK